MKQSLCPILEKTMSLQHEGTDVKACRDGGQVWENQPLPQ